MAHHVLGHMTKKLNCILIKWPIIGNNLKDSPFPIFLWGDCMVFEEEEEESEESEGEDEE